MSNDKKELSDIHSDCGASEPYALQVTDDSMEPEFPKNCIIIIDPVGNCDNGQYVFIEFDGVRTGDDLRGAFGESRLDLALEGRSV